MLINSRCSQCGHPSAEVDTFELIRRWCHKHGCFITPDEAVYEDDAALLLGRAPGTLANWRATLSGPPYHRHGRTGRVRYRLRDIADFLDGDRVND